ncbi:MAG TPA: hypothetical protein VK475_04705, partial [Pyrinomonadaceae bacterium]|nr:hypothetical protein [Pyrinomonadaceae bacterium]
LVFLWLRSADLAVQRVRERVHAGGHDVAEESIRRRYQRGLKNFWRLYRPLADRWAVYDNSRSSLPIIVAQGTRTGLDAVLDSDSWSEFREISQ